MNLIFWLITPPNNIKSFISEVARIWNGDVIVISCHHIRRERINTGYTESISGIKKMYILDDEEDSDIFAKEYIEVHKSDIHIFGGLRTGPAKYMYYMRDKYKEKAHIVAFTEKPALNSGGRVKCFFKKTTQYFFYPCLYKKAMRTVDFLLVVGQSGITSLKKYGWKADNIYDFMYSDNFLANKVSKVTTKPLRFLYVGRFDFRMRGLDVLMSAFDRLEPDRKYSISLVGGYGSNKEDVLEWIEKKENAYFNGTWPPDKVLENMADYDVYICPVKEDSWNGQINMALCAGLAVITTDQAGSDELVVNSNTGMVVKSRDVAMLSKAIDYAIHNIDVVNQWKQNARTYSKRITSSAVAEYFCHLIENKICGMPVDCRCPWLK